MTLVEAMSSSLRIGDLHGHFSLQMIDVPEADHGKADVEPGADSAEWQDGGVFHHRAAVDFRVAFNDAAASDDRQGANPRVGADIGWRHNARLAVNPRALARPTRPA